MVSALADAGLDAGGQQNHHQQLGDERVQQPDDFRAGLEPDCAEPAGPLNLRGGLPLYRGAVLQLHRNRLTNTKYGKKRASRNGLAFFVVS